MKYGLKPVQQKQAWIRMARAIRTATNLTGISNSKVALVWSPNIGAGYPFFGSGFDFNIPSRNTDPDNFELLDTNGDGVLNPIDDPYLPFYPGKKNLT